MTLGTKLYNLREERNISLEKLAFELDLSKTAIGKWEADKTMPSMKNMLKICDYYEIEPYELLGDLSNVSFENAKFKGSSYVINPTNSTINYSNSPEILKNQEKITTLIQHQNELITKLIDGQKR